MKTTQTTQLLLAVSLVMASSSLFAATQTGTLASAANSTDFYLITCSDTTTYRLNFSIKDTTANSVPFVGGQVTKGWIAANTVDLIDTNTTFSTAVNVLGGAGNYLVTVDKDAVGTEAYTFNYTCQTQAGVATKTAATIKILQNQ